MGHSDSGRFGACVWRVAGSNPTLATTYEPWASPSVACVQSVSLKSPLLVSNGRFGVKFRHSICAVLGAPLSSSGLEEAL